MRRTIQDHGIDKLSRYDRMGLVEQLWASLPVSAKLRERDERENRTEARPPYLPYRSSTPNFVFIEDYGFDSLTTDEKIEYAFAIQETISAEGPVPLTVEQEAELQRRLDDADANPDDLVTPEELAETLAKILKR